VEEQASNYQFTHNLTNGGTLFWSVIDNQFVDGMLSYDGLLGFLAFGFAGSPEWPNAMSGATILMAKPSSVYSASLGFDLSSLEDAEPVVEEHVIDPEWFAFRHWATPVTAVSRSESSVYGVEEGDCFTFMTFQTTGIFNRTFNLSGEGGGTDRMIWSANGEDSFAGYHGSSRGVLFVNWSAGTVELKDEKPAEEDNHDDNDHEDDAVKEDGGSSRGMRLVLFVSFLAMMAL
jgi:hypothetical protein